MSSSPGADAATITVEAFVGTARSALRAISRTISANDLIRSGITLTGGPSLSLSPFEDMTLVNSVCAATAPGRTFASGTLDTRLEAVRTFARDNRGIPVSVIYTEAELNQSIAANAPTAQGVTLNDAKIIIDGGGIHWTAKAATQFITVNASADVITTKAALRLLGLPSGPVRLPLVDATAEQIEVLRGDCDPVPGEEFGRPHVRAQEGLGLSKTQFFRPDNLEIDP